MTADDIETTDAARDSASEKSEKKGKKAKAAKGPKRFERRFFPQSAHKTWLVGAVGGVGAALLGAGGWAHTYGHVFEGDETLEKVPTYLVAAGAIMTGVAIWLGTSSDAPIRVGDPGIAMERGELRRMPWWSVAQISWESGTSCLVVTGNDESGSSWTFKVSSRSHRDAVGWIVAEAKKRVPKVVDIADDVIEHLPRASENAGMKVALEPLQVVGRKCAKSGKTISFEPDARVCTTCERVYFKRSVPKKCKCGTSLAHLQGSMNDEDETSEETDATA